MMKLTVCLSAPLLALLALPAGLRAAGPDAPANPYAGLDPDGVPLAVTQGMQTSETEQSDVDLRAQAEAEAHARNWLLLDYQQQLMRNKAEASPNGQALNIYLQLSMNEDIAHIIDPSTTEPDATATPTTPPLHATPSPAIEDGNRMSLRPDSAPASTLLTPLVSPFSSASAISATQPFNASAYASPLPPSLAPTPAYGASTDSPVPAPAPAPAPTSLPTTLTDTVDMQTPGMVADKSTALPGTPDLNLDSLPDQNADGTQDAQPADAPPQLPKIQQVMDADQLHSTLDAKLTVRKVALNPSANPATPPKPAQPPPPEEPMPVSHQPMISPVHAPLPNPYDVLNR